MPRTSFFLLPLFCTALFGMDESLAPENTDIYSDIDEVFIEKSSLHLMNLVLCGIVRRPLNSPAYINSLLKLQSSYHKDATGLNETLLYKDGSAIEGITNHFLYHGMQDDNLTPYVEEMIKSMESSRSFIPGTRSMYKYLKNNKGYEINFATNKDRLSYDLTTHALGKKFTDIPTKTFVAHPGNNPALLQEIAAFATQSHVAQSYKDLVVRILTIQESDNIVHALSRKPEADYFQCLINNSSTKKHIVFIDDNPEHVKGFLALQKTTAIKLYGIHFINPTQLADELVTLGILSEEHDHSLLKKIKKT